MAEIFLCVFIGYGLLSGRPLIFASQLLSFFFVGLIGFRENFGSFFPLTHGCKIFMCIHWLWNSFWSSFDFCVCLSLLPLPLFSLLCVLYPLTFVFVCPCLTSWLLAFAFAFCLGSLPLYMLFVLALCLCTCVSSWLLAFALAFCLGSLLLHLPFVLAICLCP
jgi:hypothetical protein